MRFSPDPDHLLSWVLFFTLCASAAVGQPREEADDRGDGAGGGTPPPVGAGGTFLRLSRNLGQVNGPEADFAFTPSSDGRTAYLGRPGVHGGTDLFEATRDASDQPFTRVTNLGPAVNSVLADSFPTITDDGRMLVFQRFDPGVQGSADLYMVRRAGPEEAFGDAERLPEPISGAFADYLPWISGDGLLLLFVSTRPGGEGRGDIWVAERAALDDPFGDAVNLNDYWPGSRVNTSLNEERPFLSRDGLTLFFSDQENPPYRAGVSGNIWVATRPAADAPFGEPVNLNDFGLGSEVNQSTSHELWPALTRDWPASGAKLYFASNRAGTLGAADIWEVTWFGEDCIVADGASSLDCNANRVLDACEVEHGGADDNTDGVLDECETRFLRGNVNQDRDVDLTDVIFVLNYLFGGGGAPSCIKSADFNDNGELSITDPVFLVNYLFNGRSEPATPFSLRRSVSRCGVDPTPDALPCDSYAFCE